MTRDQLERGMYRRVLRGVYADPGMRIDHELVARAAALLMPPGAALAGRSAAVWWGGRTAGVRDPVRVVLPTSSAWRGPRGVLVHRTDLRTGDVVEQEEGIRVTTLERTAWDVAALETLRDAVACLDAHGFAGKLTDQALRRVDGRAAGAVGVAARPQGSGAGRRPGAEPAGVLGARRLPPGRAACAGAPVRRRRGRGVPRQGRPGLAGSRDSSSSTRDRTTSTPSRPRRTTPLRGPPGRRLAGHPAGQRRPQGPGRGRRPDPRPPWPTAR